MPAAVSLGIPPISAHLFVIYYASVAVITPPTGGVFFLAASMADAPPYKTGWAATRLAFAAFIVPFVWIYRPGLLLMGSPLEIVVAIAVGLAAVIVLALAIEGYFVRQLNILERLLLALGVFGFIFGTLIQVMAGVGLVTVVLLLHWLKAKRLAGVQAGRQ